MTLLAVIATGAGVGFGLFLIGRALFPPPVALHIALADLRRPRYAIGDTGQLSPRRVTERAGMVVVRILEATGLVDVGRLRRRLRTLDKTIEAHAYEKLVTGAAGFGIPVVFTVVAAVGGVNISAGWTVTLAVAFGLAGFMYPDLGLTERIERRRRDFRHSLSAYLDLVTIILAGGGGLETALHTAADLGDGWAFTEIRSALRRARLTNRTPWDVFDELGEELGVDELRELAAAAHLAGDQGARIRASLSAKADSMRSSQTAAIEAQAESATEKMLLPVVTLVVGMILFIGFGVVEAISTPGTVP
ncbi:MAG: type II secretion system F family protein [Acidimicrobiia bacterium]